MNPAVSDLNRCGNNHPDNQIDDRAAQDRVRDVLQYSLIHAPALKFRQKLETIYSILESFMDVDVKKPVEARV
jgi:hypothetical protein